MSRRSDSNKIFGSIPVIEAFVDERMDSRYPVFVESAEGGCLICQNKRDLCIAFCRYMLDCERSMTIILGDWFLSYIWKGFESTRRIVQPLSSFTEAFCK